MSQSARGRQASTPSAIPAQGWKDVLWRVYGEISDDRVMLIAAGVTYYLLLALVPGLTALISIYGLFFDPATIQDHAAALQGFIPGGGMEILNEQMSRIAQQGQTKLGITFAISLAIALWSANAGMKSLFEAMNVAYDEKEKRGFIKLTLTSLAFTLAAIIGIICLVGVVAVMPLILSAVGFGSGVEWLIRIASYAGVLLLASLGAAALFRWGPSRASPKWKWITPGTILSVIVVLVMSVLFSWYVANFGSYNATYGSLGALIGFMTWIWLSVTILIVGGELNAEMEHQTAKDTTTEPARPLGQRGANMADHVASARGGDRQEEDRTHGSDHDQRRSQHRDRRVSAGNLAFAIPAALLLTWMQRRSHHR